MAENQTLAVLQEILLKSRIKFVTGTEAEWTAANPVLLDGEYGLIRGSSPLKYKVGDGTKTWSALEMCIRDRTLAEWGWPLGAIFAAIVGAMGAAQIAMIASTPITTGAEEGGQVIERMQDGKKFNARYSPDKRGFISSPTVLVSENGKEYVVPAAAMDNPSLIPVLNTIEAARRQGTLGSFDFNAVYRQNTPVPGFVSRCV